MLYNNVRSFSRGLRGCFHGGRKILALGRSQKAEQRFVWFTCRNFYRSGYQVEMEKKKNCPPLAAERPPAAMFVLFVPSTRIFRAKVVYMALGSSYLSARKILSLLGSRDPSAWTKFNVLHVK